MRRTDRKCYFHGPFVTYPLISLRLSSFLGKLDIIDSHLRLVNATFPTEGKAFCRCEQPSPPRDRANKFADDQWSPLPRYRETVHSFSAEGPCGQGRGHQCNLLPERLSLQIRTILSSILYITKLAVSNLHLRQPILILLP